MDGIYAVGGDSMRMARKNQTPLWYSVMSDSDISYVRDENGNIVYQEIDGEQVPVETGKSGSDYSKPVPFLGTIQNAGGVAEAQSYGVSVGSYQARLIDVVGGLPIKEMSLIWTHEPTGECDDKADYRVVNVPIALNQVTYLLKRNE